MLRAVIVDDDQALVRRLESQINWDARGYALVGTAFCAEDGYRLVQDLNPDVLIADVFMPGVTGIEMVKRIREENTDLRIIMMTECNHFRSAYEAMQFNLIQLLSKPLRAEQVAGALISARESIERDSGRFFACSVFGEGGCVNSRMVGKIVAYMERHYREKLNLDVVAKVFYISSWHLCKLFKKYTERSFIDVLNTIRLRKAQEFLKNSGLKIYEIASRVGYNDLAYFTVLFKKTVGMTPSRYRNFGEGYLDYGDLSVEALEN